MFKFIYHKFRFFITGERTINEEIKACIKNVDKNLLRIEHRGLSDEEDNYLHRIANKMDERKLKISMEERNPKQLIIGGGRRRLHVPSIKEIEEQLKNKQVLIFDVDGGRGKSQSGMDMLSLALASEGIKPILLPGAEHVIENAVMAQIIMNRQNIEVIVVDSVNEIAAEAKLNQDLERLPPIPIKAPQMVEAYETPKSGREKRRDKRQGKSKNRKFGYK